MPDALVPVAPRDPAPLRAELEDLAAAAEDLAAAGVAENTRRAYASDWRDFSSWCGQRGLPDTLPTDLRILALYLTARVEGGVAVSTMERRFAGLRAAHRQAEAPWPDGVRLDELWAGVRRTYGRPPRKKRALVVEDLRRVVRALPKDDLAGVRDRALLLVGFGSAMRRSELAALELDGPGAGALRVGFEPEGLLIAIDRSKGDQTGRGAVVGLPYARSALCPVGALRAWLDAAGIASGPVFRAIDRHGRLGDALSGAAIAAVVKRAAERVGLDPDLFAGHSMRSGLVTTALERGVDHKKIMDTTRHKKVETMLGYGHTRSRFKNSAAGQIL